VAVSQVRGLTEVAEAVNWSGVQESVRSHLSRDRTDEKGGGKGEIRGRS